ncbi:hypothetical protein [Bacillus mycoides]|uniref:hypothetical protein n=1 Tax=Bacillus mycoides TaxID=1405 RepID=UPI0012FB930A|nr:hypothetical protein [Bacillus mycoides]
MINTIYLKHGNPNDKTTLPIEGDKITIFVGQIGPTNIVILSPSIGRVVLSLGLPCFK